MTNRIGPAIRKTKEVDIEIEIRLDEPGQYQISITADKEETDFGFAALHRATRITGPAIIPSTKGVL